MRTQRIGTFWAIRQLFWALVLAILFLFGLFVGTKLLVETIFSPFLPVVEYIFALLAPFDIEAVVVLILMVLAFIDSRRGAERYRLFK